jgi:hypothetical protein
LNSDFFSSWSREMAYVLGVIYTDGNLFYGFTNPRQRKPVGILQASQKQPELLEKILALMNCNAQLVFSKKRQSDNIVAGELYHFRIFDDKIYSDLVKLGLTPRKSLTMTFPDVPMEYVRHFIRGCWDGDGSVYIDKQSKTISASYISGSLKFVEGLVTALKDAGFPERKIYINKGKSPSYYIRVTGTQVPKLYHYLYDDVPESQYLDRKYKLFYSSL